MDKSQKNIQKYHIVFTGSNHKSWMMRCLNKSFKHVYAVKKSPGGQFWIIINPLSAYTDVDLKAVIEYPHIRSIVKENDVVLSVQAVIKERERWTLCIINCVEVVKSLIGVRAFWVFTPHQLYKYLLRGDHGWQEIK